MTPKRYSFTVKSSTMLNSLVTSCGVYPTWTPEDAAPPPPLLQFNALWDTGATISMITKRVVDKLALPVEGYTNLWHVQGMSEGIPVYQVNLVLLEGLHLIGVNVVLGAFPGTDVLIGMDIINRGDFAVSNKNGATSFSYRIPSTEDFDFAAADNI